MAEIEAEIRAEIEQWTPVKEDMLFAAQQCDEVLFNITSSNCINKGVKEKVRQEIATEVELKKVGMSGKQN